MTLPQLRKGIVLLHTVLAAFFLPMGLMYAVTGGLYGLGIKGDYRVTEHELALESPLAPDLAALVALAQQALDSRGIAPPSGSAGVRRSGTSFHLEWTGSRRDVELHPTADAGRALLKVKETDAHRFFVQLHKAKGAEAFKWFAAAWMVGLVLLLLSGGFIAIATRPYRRMACTSAAAGLAAFALLAWIS